MQHRPPDKRKVARQGDLSETLFTQASNSGFSKDTDCLSKNQQYDIPGHCIDRVSTRFALVSIAQNLQTGNFEDANGILRSIGLSWSDVIGGAV